MHDMRDAGMSHLMAVSGLHIGIAWLILWILFKPLVLIAYRMNQNEVLWNYIVRGLALIIIWLYVWMIGFPPSAVRAAIMISIIQLSNIVYIEAWNWSNLIIAALLMLCYDPSLMGEAGFQLSFAATAGIYACRPLFIGHRTRYEKYHKMPLSYRLRYFVNLFWITFSAQLFTLPLCAYYFHHLPLLGFVQGILVVPFVAFFIYGIIFLLVCPYSLCSYVIAGESLYHWLSLPVEAISWWILHVAHWVSQCELWLVGGRVEFYPSLTETIVLELIIIGLTCAWRGWESQRVKRPR